MKQRLSFRVGEFLYRNAYPVYRPLYFSYKRIVDRGEINLIRSLVRPGDVVLDIGSNIGFYSRMLSDLAGAAGEVHCFEPDKDNFRHLAETIGNRTNVTLNNMAVGDYTGESELYISHRLNVDHRTYEPEKYEYVYSIQMIRIDDYIPHGKKVNFIKMDIQGGEYKALLGMTNTLGSNPNIAVLTEFAPSFFKRDAGIEPDAFIDFFINSGFRLFSLKNKELQPFKLRDASMMFDEFYENIFAIRDQDI